MAVELEGPVPRRAEVLVVDDDEVVRRALARLLSRDHDVRTAGDAAQALALVRAGARFDALLCDLMMPGMTGAALHAALLREAPDQARRFALLTGGGSAAEALAEACSCPVLQKPCSREGLLACVRALQGGGASHARCG